MKGPGNVMLIQKRIQKADTFVHQEYSNKYVHGGKGFFYMVGENANYQSGIFILIN